MTIAKLTRAGLIQNVVPLIGLFALLVQAGCSSGLEAGSGPGFSTFDPAITGEELWYGIRSAGEIDEDEVPFGETVTQDCPDGGSQSLSKTLDESEEIATFELVYSECATAIEVRESSYDVTIQGTFSYTFSETHVTVAVALSFSGDLGFAAECDGEAPISYDSEESDPSLSTLQCRFFDSEGNVVDYLP